MGKSRFNKLQHKKWKAWLNTKKVKITSNVRFPRKIPAGIRILPQPPEPDAKLEIFFEEGDYEGRIVITDLGELEALHYELDRIKLKGLFQQQPPYNAEKPKG